MRRRKGATKLRRDNLLEREDLKQLRSKTWYRKMRYLPFKAVPQKFLQVCNLQGSAWAESRHF